MGRYRHVARHLAGHGAAVHAMDHAGHGRSAGARALIRDFEDVVTDFHAFATLARRDTPNLPVVLIGHSMGGMIAARYAQRYPGELAALILTGPVLGRWRPVEGLLELDAIPDTPLDPATLSRDPAVGDDYAADPLVWHGPFQRPTVQALTASLGLIARSGTLGRTPTLWIHGGDDRLVPIADTRAGIQQIQGTALTARIVDGARHEVLNETDKDRTLAGIADFIDNALGAAR